MIFDVDVALTWLLFLALFPIAFFWLRAAWRIAARRDFSEVALKRGVPPPNPARFAPYALMGNLIGGVVIVTVILGVVIGGLDYNSWTAMAGITIWCKFFFNFILSRQAHYGAGSRKI